MNTTTEALTQQDIKILREEIRQKLLVLLLIGSIVLIILLSMVFYLKKTEFVFFYMLCFMIVLATASWLFINPELKDLNEQKLTITGKIDNKKVTTNYGVNYNAISNIQATLKEYYIIVDSKNIPVEKRFYEEININDSVKISIRYYSKKLLNVEKV